MSVSFDPIGKVVIENGRYYIELQERFYEATLGIREYSHIQVIWWFHLYDSPESRKNPMLIALPRKGFPACHTRKHPRSAGLNCCARPQKRPGK